MDPGVPPNRFYPEQNYEHGESAIAKAVAAGTLTPRDVDLIKEYIHEREAEVHLSIARVIKVMYALISWRRFLRVELPLLTLPDIYDGITRIKTGISSRGTPYKQNTLHDQIRILKQFLLWAVENEYLTLPEKKIRAIKTPPVNCFTTEPDEILSYDEIVALIRGCRSSRDRAIIATLYESGCRIGELGRLRWRDIVFDDYGVKMYIDDRKTRKRRYVRLALAREYLAAYRNDYSGDPSGDAIVFITKLGTPMEYQAYKRALITAATRGGVTKKVKPHLFRKSRITHMISQNYQESVIKRAMWGNLDTKMMKTYLVQSESDIDAEFLDKAGIRSKADTTRPLGPVPCPRCHTINGPTSAACSHCGLPLTEGAALELDEAVDRIEESQLYRHAVEKALEILRSEMALARSADVSERPT